MDLEDLILWLKANYIEYEEFLSVDDEIVIQYWYNNYERCEAIYNHLGKQMGFETYTEYGV